MAKYCPGEIISPSRSILICLALALPVQPAIAQDEAQPAAVRPLAIAATSPDMDMFGTAPLPDAILAATTGREKNNWMSASSNNSAIVGNNKVGDNSITGDVNVKDAAFQNVSGISMVNFNTGNNSSINAAMSVNLQINYASPTQ